MDDEFIFPFELSSAAADGPDPLAPERGIRVVLVLDRRECSMTAVREALSLALRHRVQLEVALINTRPGHLSGMAGWAMVPPVVLTALDDSMAALVFHQVAAVLAPSGIAWDFVVLRRPDVLALLGDPAGQVVLLVVPRHSAWLRGGLVAAVSSYLAAAGGDAAATHRIAVVPCEHRRFADESAELRAA